jgi:hypothetical protein
VRRGRTRAVIAISSIGILAVAAVGALSGIAAAVSGGGYNPNQQDCPWNASAWSTPNGYTYPGCHNVAVNVESGGTTNGDANANNTRYVEFGNDQAPNDPNSQGTPTLLSIGLPGNSGSPHAGCVSVNTDGTGGGPGTGCGDNPNGAGFTLNYDYYQVFCPIAAAAGQPCEDTNPGTNSLTPDQGSAVDYQSVVSNGLVVYFGMDDNTDNGEHDGFSGANNTAGAINGPSDGGSMILSIEPQWLMNPSAPTATHPEGLVNYSEGECADGICGGVTTQQQTVYYGCYDPANPQSQPGGAWYTSGTDGATNPQNDSSDVQCASGTPQSTNVYENGSPSSTTESYNCNSGDLATEMACYQNANGTSNPGGADTYRAGTPQQVNAEPGLQTYQDPDPQRSPAAPFATPGAYAGTCGVYLNDSGGYGEPGVSGFFLGPLAGTTNPVNGQPANDPGYVVATSQPGC